MKRLAIFVVPLLLLGACTTQRSDAPAEVAAAPDEAVTTTAADVGTPTQSADQPTTTEAPVTTTAPEDTTTTTASTPAATPTTQAPADPEPTLVAPDYIPTVTLVMVSPDTGGGPITIVIGSTETSVDVTLEAESVPYAVFDYFRWFVDDVNVGPTYGDNPVQRDFTLTIPGGQSFATFNIRAEAWDFTSFTPGSDTIEITVMQGS